MLLYRETSLFKIIKQEVLLLVYLEMLFVQYLFFRYFESLDDLINFVPHISKF